MTTERESALERIVADEIAAHMATAKAPERQGNMVKALLGYTGGTFIFAGLGLLVSIIWPDISPLQRVIITLGPGMIAFVRGVMAASSASGSIVNVTGSMSQSLIVAPV